MGLDTALLQQINDPTLGLSQRAALQCALAKELEEAGNYEGAQAVLESLWPRLGERPMLEGLEERTRASVLLRTGALTGWIGSARLLAGAQEEAKDLLTESRILFEALNEQSRAAEAEIEIAICYWREGAYDEARVTLCDALSRLTEQDNDLKAVALIRRAIVERMTRRLRDAFNCLTEAAPLVEASTSHSLKGRFHVELAVVLRNISTVEKREDYIDQALVEYTAASFHFQEANHQRYCALTENNLGYLLFTLGRFVEAHEHLDRARRMFANLKESGSVAQVDDTRARAFLAQGKNLEAERVARAAVQVQQKGGEQAFLAEALTTHGTALARLQRVDEGRATLERAIEIASLAGSKEGAGLAAIAMIEELGERLSASEIVSVYERAASLLGESQHQETLARLVKCSRQALAALVPRRTEFKNTDFLYASSKASALLSDAYRLAEVSGAILITGETGTGKEVLARLIHQWSGRRGDFVAVNFVELTDALAASEIFGHKRGSFADAIEDHAGAVKKAAGGTLFLDEVTKLSLSNQGRLLRLIEYGEIQPIGAGAPEYLDVRVIASTSLDLKEEVKRKRFRSDLFYKLQTFHLEVPPLRERPEDIRLLSEHFIERALASTGKRVTFTDDALECLCNLPLDGNARELQSLIERSISAAADNSLITAQAVDAAALRHAKTINLAEPWGGCSLPEEVNRYEAKLIRLALTEAKGSVVGAARLLGVSHQTLSFALQKRHQDLKAATKSGGRRRRSIMRLK